MATYGTRDNSKFHYPRTPIEEVRKEKYYTVVDSTNGTIYLKKINPDNFTRSEQADPVVGILKVGENKVKEDPFWKNSVSQKEIEFFNQQRIIDDLRKKGENTVINAQVRLGVDRSVATTRAKNLIRTGSPQVDPQGNRIPSSGRAGDRNPDEPQPTGSPVSREETPITAVLGVLTYPKGKTSYRYPLTIIDKNDKGKGTDYLLIGIKTYKSIGIGNQLIRGTNQLNVNISEAGATIILPIPSNVQDGNSVSYADGSLDGITAAVAEGALNAMQTQASPAAADQITSYMKNLANNIGDLGTTFTGTPFLNLYLKGLAAQAANLPGIGNVTREQILSRESGGILNPNMELFFNGVALRSFKFSFKMTPRSQKESEELQYMIKTLKANMAPKVTTENNQFLRTPNVFDLEYRRGGQPHPFLHKFKTCALTDMGVNYTGEGIYATYNDASPVSMIMDLTFKELEPIFDSDYEGVGGVGY